MDHVRKLVSLSLLLFALVDLCVPGICKADVPSSTDPVSAANLHSEEGLWQAGETRLTILCSPVEHSNSSDEDQCFCCSHVVPGSQLAFLPAYVTLGDVSKLRVEDRLGYFAPPHHPPRS